MWPRHTLSWPTFTTKQSSDPSTQCIRWPPFLKLPFKLSGFSRMVRVRSGWRLGSVIVQSCCLAAFFFFSCFSRNFLQNTRFQQLRLEKCLDIKSHPQGVGVVGQRYSSLGPTDKQLQKLLVKWVAFSLPEGDGRTKDCPFVQESRNCDRTTSNVSKTIHLKRTGWLEGIFYPTTLQSLVLTRDFTCLWISHQRLTGGSNAFRINSGKHQVGVNACNATDTLRCWTWHLPRVHNWATSIRFTTKRHGARLNSSMQIRDPKSKGYCQAVLGHNLL